MRICKSPDFPTLADNVFKGCECGDGVENPDGILLGAHAACNRLHGAHLLAVARAGEERDENTLKQCAERGVVVFHSPGAGANALKELILGELVLCARKIAENARRLKSCKGRGNLAALIRKNAPHSAGRELCGKTLGIIGIGEAAEQVSGAALSLGMQVVAATRFFDARVQFTEKVDEVFLKSDFIVLLPSQLAPIGGKLLEKCRDGAALLNNAAENAVESDAVISALRSGKIGYYITDFPREDLLGEPNVLCLPLLGTNTPEAEEHGARTSALNMKEYLESGNIRGSANFPDVYAPKTGSARLCVHHRNEKEILQKILSVISAQGMHAPFLQDASRGAYAYLILDLDEVPCEACLELVRHITGVLRVRLL